jgi:hypothetical protein
MVENCRFLICCDRESLSLQIFAWAQRNRNEARQEVMQAEFCVHTSCAGINLEAEISDFALEAGVLHLQLQGRGVAR